VRLKTLGVGGIFLVTLFFAVEKRVTGSKGFETKTFKDEGAQRAFSLCTNVVIETGGQIQIKN